MPFVGGLIIGLGVVLLTSAAIYEWFARSHIYSVGYGTRRTQAEREEADVRGQQIADRLAALSRKGVWPAVVIIVVGIVVAAA